MNPIIVLVVFGITVVVAYIFGRATAHPIDDVTASPSTRVDTSNTSDGTSSRKKERKAGSADTALQDRVKKLENELKSATNAAKSSEERHKKLHEDLKDAKQRAHDRGQRLDQARKDLEDERRRAKSLGSVAAARKELLAVKEDNERLKSELQKAKDHAPAPKVVEIPKESSAPEASHKEVQAYAEKLDKKDRELRRALHEQAQELKTSLDAQVADERARAKSKIRDLQGKLRHAQRDANKERRRSDANDRAYLILKSQLENTLDRLAFYDESLHRPDELARPTAPAKAADNVAPKDETAAKDKAGDTAQAAPTSPQDVPAATPAEAAEDKAEPAKTAPKDA